jgi:RimJ/RimL family protein N-acetyltransferase
MAHPLWPLYDLRLRTERLELRLPHEDEIVALCTLAKAGIHPVDEMPFAVPWTRKPSPRFERDFYQYYLKLLADWRAEEWSLVLGVFRDGEPIGVQELAASSFASLRQVATGSWLGRDHQRQGHGTAMRGAILALAFEGLGAEIAETSAFLDNAASAGVSRALGYAPNGLARLAPDGVPRDMEKFRMTSEAWQARPRPPVVIEGLAAGLDLFGVTPSPRVGPDEGGA